MAISFEPKPLQVVSSPEPVEAEFGDPRWVLDTWRKLYYNFPSEGLKKRVEETEKWVDTLE